MGKYSKSQLLELIEEWVIGRNAKRNKKIIKDKLIEGYTYSELGDKYHLSDNQVKNIILNFRQLLDESTL